MSDNTKVIKPTVRNPSLARYQDDSSVPLTQAELVQLKMSNRRNKRNREGIQIDNIQKGMILELNHLDERGLFSFLKNALKMRKHVQEFTVLRDDRLLDPEFLKENTETQSIKMSDEALKSYEDISKKVANLLSQHEVVAVRVDIKAKVTIFRAKSNYNYELKTELVKVVNESHDVFGELIRTESSSIEEIPVSPALQIKYLNA